MAHEHAENEGDFLKHVVLEELLIEIAGLKGVDHIRYIDPYAAADLYSRTNVPHVPISPVGKVRVWKNQQANPKWYLGSPLIALQVLQKCCVNFSLVFSDSDGPAIRCLKNALKRRAKGYRPGKVPNDTAVQIATYTDELDSALVRKPAALNVVLLDPTRKGRYRTTINNSITACRNNECNIVLMCWGLQRWEWPKSFAAIATRAHAVYAQGKYPSVVHLLWFGPWSDQLANATRACVRGW